jgi:drug/metabolite transporter (DMT)-like permease
MGAILWFFAISKIGSGATSLLEKTNVLFVFLLVSIFLKEKIKFMEVVYVGIAISGLFFIFKIGGGLMNIGAWAILAGELLYSTQSMLVRKFGKNINSFYFTYMRSLGMFVVIGLFFGMMGKIDFVDIKVFCLITGSMFVGAFVGKYFYFEAHKYFSISKIGFLLLLESVGTVLGAYLFFGDPITIQKITGAVLIIAGAGLFIRERQQQSST